MFSENNRISERQTFRLLTYDLLGLSTLLIPSVLAEVAGRDGIFSIAVGVAAGLLYLWGLGALVKDCAVPFPVRLEQCLGKVCGKLVQAGFFLYLLALGGYTAYLFADVVLKSLLREESFYLVLAVELALVLYGLWGGLEGRARIYEILFWILLIPLFVMLFFSLDEIRTDYWSPVFTAGAGNVLAGGFYMFSGMAVIFLVLFLGNYVEKKERLLAAGKRAVLLTGGIHAALYLILLGVFGDQALAAMKYPAVTLMSTVRISGEFLRRTDALMFAVWFFTLYALLASCVFYCGILLVQMFDGCLKRCDGQRSEKGAYVATVAAVGALACTFYRSAEWMERCTWLLWHIGTPFVVLAPLLLLLGKGVGKRFRQAGRTTAMVLVVCLFGGTFAGCATAELEDRDFPLEIAVTDREDLTSEFLDTGNEGSRLVDYSHLKVLILSESFAGDEALMWEFLELLEQKNEIPQSTYLVVAEDADAVAGMEESLGEPVGTYLEQTFENASRMKKGAYPTLGMLYQECENRRETLFLPYVKKEGKNLAISDYYVWQRGRPCSVIDSGTAQLSFFTQGQMEEYPLVLDDSAAVSLSGVHTGLTFSEENGRKTVTAKVRCSGEWTGAGTPDEGERKRVAEQANVWMDQMAEQALAKRQVDVTNSFRELGAKRDWYFYYQDKSESYEQDIEVKYDLVIDWVNL